MTSLPLLYDVFCGAGGATKGYQRAGFRVIGIDCKSQPRYCGDGFLKMDAFDFFDSYARGEFERATAFSASPPCQFYSEATPMWARENHPDLIAATREVLADAGRPFVIENVAGARRHLVNPVMLCGTMFGMPLWRHRYFEINPALGLLTPPCAHRPGPITVHTGSNTRKTMEPVLVSGGGDGKRTLRKNHRPRERVDTVRWAMRCEWMIGDELDEAIPPAYTEWLGRRLLEQLA